MNKVVPIPSHDQVTQIQIGTVLNAIATMIPLMHLRHDDIDGGIMDGGTKSAVQSSLITACNRLDEIMKDNSRWGMNKHNELEKQLSNLYHEHTRVLKMQQQQIEYLSRPHARHNPQLGRMRDGSWIAVLGDINDIDNSIVGIGESPAKALEAFDEMFNSGVPAHLLAWIMLREAALKNNQTPPTKKEYDEKQTMDPNGPISTSGPKEAGLDPRGDSDETGPEPDGSGPEMRPPSDGPEDPERS
jgi:hypothetical protein